VYMELNLVSELNSKVLEFGKICQNYNGEVYK
jgi:hypothetical protein